MVSLLSADLELEVLPENLFHDAKRSKCDCQKAPDTKRDTDQSWSENQLGSVSGSVPTITCLLSERVKLKSETSLEATWLQADDKRSAYFLGTSVFLKKKGCFVELLKNIYLAERLTYFPPCVWCWTGGRSTARWPDKKCECVCSVLHSSLRCIACMTYTL